MRSAILSSVAVLLAACATREETRRGEIVSAQQEAQALARQERVSTEQRATTTEQTVHGRVMEVQGNEIQIWTPQNQDLKLDLSASMVRFDGQQGSVAQIKPGSDVRASYKMVGGQAKALQIDVTSH